MSEKQVTILSVVILAVILVAGGAAVWYFQFNVLVKDKDELAALEKQVSEDRAKRDQIERLEKEIAKLKEDEAREIERVPNLDRSEYDRFIDGIERMRRQAGTIISEARLGQAGRGQPLARGAGAKALPPFVKQVDYEFNCQGPFFPLLRFMNLLETEKRFIEIGSCTISSSKRDLSPGVPGLVRDMRISVVTYSFQPSGRGAAAPGPQEEAPLPSTPLP